MSSVAPSIDVAVHTLRARQAACRQIVGLIPDDSSVRHFLDDVARHYDDPIADFEAGRDLGLVRIAAVQLYIQAIATGRYQCATAYADIAHALGVDVEYA